jgi:nucleotide-binding universal stress UspA family protein
MTYKDIVVYLDGSPENQDRLDLAVALAKTFEARLTGVDVSTEAAFKSEWAERAAGVQDLFEQRAAQIGLRHRFSAAGRGSQNWQDLRPHYADLLIGSQPNAATSGYILPAIPQELLMSSGVPMIVTPPRWHSGPIGRNIIVAWSPSREATRAVHDAIPLLARASKVTLFAFDLPANLANGELELLRDHLGEHGVKSEIESWPDTGEITAIDALFASRAMEEADMIVAGAYGHSRLLESLFGGMTENLLHQISMPVLVSH